MGHQEVKVYDWATLGTEQVPWAIECSNRFMCSNFKEWGWVHSHCPFHKDEGQQWFISKQEKREEKTTKEYVFAEQMSKSRGTYDMRVVHADTLTLILTLILRYLGHEHWEL